MQTIDRKALSLVILTYFLWGLFPLYFYQLSPANPFEVITYRAVFGLICCVLWLGIRGRLHELRELSRRDIGWLLASGLLIGVNWTTYIYTVLTHNTIDASIGYFINPLITVLLGVVVLREKLRSAYIVALVLGIAAVAVLVIAHGRLPWTSLVLATSFGLYGLVKKQIAGRVRPVSGMLVETVTLVPFALAYYIPLLMRQGSSVQLLWAQDQQTAIVHFMLLAGSGLITMIPLIMFAMASGNLPLSVIGLVQYLAPTMSFVIGLLVFHEAMPLARWIGVIIIWVAVFILIYDGLKGGNRPKFFPTNPSGLATRPWWGRTAR
ncbi:EamA family transporter RarD [Stomatohabitans albus]|uniref:EamA family transporter RarD n=1 Tax=Stomatohabitans albus TaxID=3110766 RepID=UPI00300D840F